jgi:hypothetical protein
MLAHLNISEEKSKPEESIAIMLTGDEIRVK